MRHMLRRILTALFLLPLLLAACTLPPYDQDISLAALTAAKMEQVAVVGPFQLWRGNYDGRELYFLPLKDDLIASASMLRGYLVAAGDYVAELAAVEVGGGAYALSGSYGAQMDNSDPTRFTYAAETVKGAFNLQVVVFDPATGQRSYVRFDQYFNIMTSTGNPVDLQSELSALLVTPKAMGVHTAPAADPTYDTLQVLCRDSGGKLAEAAFQTSTATATGLSPPAAVRTGFTLPEIPTTVSDGFYGRDPAAQLSFFSFYDQAGGKWKTYSWDSAATAATELPMNRRVNAVLSTGQLFSRDGAAAYLYDSAGKQLNRIPMGGLRFLYELQSGGKYYSYFSLPVWARVVGGDGWELRLVVYRLPTTGLAGL